MTTPLERLEDLDGGFGLGLGTPPLSLSRARIVALFEAGGSFRLSAPVPRSKIQASTLNASRATRTASRSGRIYEHPGADEDAQAVEYAVLWSHQGFDLWGTCYKRLFMKLP